MQLTRFVAPVDPLRVLLHLRPPLRFLGAALVAPLLVALASREWRSAIVFAVLAASSYIVGRLGPGRPLAPSDREALVIAATVYFLFGIVGALAYWPVTSFANGLFEAMSGFTTTGLSVVDVSALPKSLLFFRSYSQWLGGAGIVVLSIAFLPGPRAALVHLYAAELKDENVLGNTVTTTRLVLKIYGALTLLAVTAFWLSGMGGFDALLHALSTLSTGGFSRHPESMGQYSGARIKLVVCLFMITGATSFPLYYRARTRGLGKLATDSQLRALILLVLIGSAFSFLLSDTDAVSALFHTISAITTTGFQVSDPSEWSEGMRMISTALMIIGGSAGSTSGGIKLYRLLIMIVLARWYVARALLPKEAHVPLRLGDRVLQEDDIRSAVGLVGLYLGLVTASALALTAAGFAPSAALFESASALGTVGLSSGITSASLPLWVKGMLVLEMWAGRLEILALLILFYPRTWHRFGGTE